MLLVLGEVIVRVLVCSKVTVLYILSARLKNMRLVCLYVHGVKVYSNKYK